MRIQSMQQWWSKNRSLFNFFSVEISMMFGCYVIDIMHFSGCIYNISRLKTLKLSVVIER